MKVAKELNRNYVGYEVYEQYKSVITNKLNSSDNLFSFQTETASPTVQESMTIKDKITFSIDEDTHGVLDYEIQGKILFISDLQVSVKRQGIGTRLLEDLENLAEYYQVEKMIVKAQATKSCLLFFLKHDFEVPDSADFTKLLAVTQREDDNPLVLSDTDFILMEKKISVAQSH